MNLVGIGVGLRKPHLPQMLQHKPTLGFMELLTDNWLHWSGLDRQQLEPLLTHYPVALHGVAMNIGGADPLCTRYLDAVKHLADATGARLISDHLCFCRHGAHWLPDLLPLPMTQATLDYLCARIHWAQEYLGQTLAFENTCRYLPQPSDALDEGEFLASLCQHTGCQLILDLSNLQVNAMNAERQGWPACPPWHIVRALQPAQLAYVHLGGWHQQGEWIIDSHCAPPCEATWSLLQQALNLWGPVAACIEWDNQLPAWSTLNNLAQRAAAITASATQEACYG